MDPLSIAAGAIAVATVAAQTCNAFAQLRAQFNNLPGRLQALHNEATDVQVVCYELARVLDETDILPGDTDQSQSLEHQSRTLLESADTKLRSINCALNHINAHKSPLTASHAFRREQQLLQDLFADIRSVRASLSVLIGTVNTGGVARIRLELESITAPGSHSPAQQPLPVRERTPRHPSPASGSTEVDQKLEMLELKSTASSFTKVNQRLERFELMISEQTRMQWNQSSQLEAFYRSRRLTERREASNSSAESSHSVGADRAGLDGVGIRLRQHVTACKKGCPCACHQRRHAESLGFIERILGRVFVGYAGLPFTTPKCDSDLCAQVQASYVNLEYWFPLGFLRSQIVRFEAENLPGRGPQMQLSILRRVPDTSPCVSFALEGNIEGLQSLFARGVASPRDVSETRGYSLLRWAVYGQQWKACKFLLTHGADPDYRPKKRTDNSPRNKANDYFLQGFSSDDAAECFREIINVDEWVDEQILHPIHLAATNLSSESLEWVVAREPENVDIVDNLGRTALTWAAARGDQHSVAVLLAHGADPNLIDSYLGGPLSYAADRGHAVCVRSLLEAGAVPDPVLPGGQISGSPLNCASRNSKDPLVIRTLLDFGADTESCGIDGMTALIHSARTDNLENTLSLLRAQADINAVSAVGQTPLTTAITHNSHGVLWLLLEKWKDYSVCPRLKGPNLINVAAQYGDVETLKILAAADHLRHNYDANYSVANCLETLKERFDYSDNLNEGMLALISVIRSNPDLDVAHHLESGHLCHLPHHDRLDVLQEASEKSSDVEFLDTFESFDIANPEALAPCEEVPAHSSVSKRRFPYHTVCMDDLTDNDIYV